MKKSLWYFCLVFLIMVSFVSSQNSNCTNLKSYNTTGTLFYAYQNPAEKVSPVYVFYANSTKGNFYTISENEKNALIKNYSHAWEYKGIEFYTYSSQEENAVPIYRFWNQVTGLHAFVMEKGKSIYISDPKWISEGIAFYVFERSENCNIVKPDSCTDTDGKNYFVKGSTKSTASGNVFEQGEDSCDGNTLVEWYCYPDVPEADTITYPCPNGCSNGACIPDNQIPFSDKIFNITPYILLQASCNEYENEINCGGEYEYNNQHTSVIIRSGKAVDFSKSTLNIMKLAYSEQESVVEGNNVYTAGISNYYFWESENSVISVSGDDYNMALKILKTYLNKYPSTLEFSSVCKPSNFLENDFFNCIYFEKNCEPTFDLNGDGMYTIVEDVPCLNLTQLQNKTKNCSNSGNNIDIFKRNYVTGDLSPFGDGYAGSSGTVYDFCVQIRSDGSYPWVNETYGNNLWNRHEVESCETNCAIYEVFCEEESVSANVIHCPGACKKGECIALSSCKSSEGINENQFVNCIYFEKNCEPTFDLNGDGIYTIVGDLHCFDSPTPNATSCKPSNFEKEGFIDCIYNNIDCTSSYDLNGDGIYTIVGDVPCYSNPTDLSSCNGCYLNSKCYPFGHRKDGKYCSDDSSWDEQKSPDENNNWAKCENNYECVSNFCSSGECIEISKVAEELSTWKVFGAKVACKLGNLLNIEGYNDCVGNRLGKAYLDAK